MSLLLLLSGSVTVFSLSLRLPVAFGTIPHSLGLILVLHSFTPAIIARLIRVLSTTAHLSHCTEVTILPPSRTMRRKSSFDPFLVLSPLITSYLLSFRRATRRVYNAIPHLNPCYYGALLFKPICQP
ncbi:hypothetical protein BDN71DRAFT_864824 [Pleurotus eryngii]|uniref:Uncharacterized protein n=1 Tax=Pleurotus eryngii TaxID=5323 RepID=A0A9P5ZVY2_PLEER|nr:hypothetical protein BDN71DRAFT_864824 [Pleurotus eryngii]